MNRQLIDYLPPVLQSVREFQEINHANEPEIKAAWEALDLVLDNQFLDSATEEGVRRWEEELDVSPAAGETLDSRKARIKILWSASLAYTFPWLIQGLSDISALASASLKDYTLTVTLPSASDYNVILDTLRTYISAAIVIAPKILLRDVETKYYTGAAFRHSVVTSMQTPPWSTSNFVLLTDEDNQVLIDGAKSVFYEEVTA